MNSKANRAIATWLFIGVFMIMIQVILGGITRLTGSGLSITEWRLLLHAVPPMNEQDWQIAFEKYKEIGQYKKINFDFTLADFKSIYFWEWFHRFWGQLIGIVFLVGFVYLLLKKYLRKELIRPMIILFLLGALQGAIGWIMVQSGLNEEDVSVSHIRLAVHFIAALVLLVYTLWFALKLIVPESQRIIHPSLKKFLTWILIIFTLQLIYGAFMAGLKAAINAPTWPDINGEWWPMAMGRLDGLKDLTDNHITVQFIHRGLAYLLVILIIVWWGKAKSGVGSSRLRRDGNDGSGVGSRLRRSILAPLVLVLVQALLGIITVLNSPDPKQLLWWGVAHQFVAMLLLISLVWVFYLIKGKSFAQPS